MILLGSFFINIFFFIREKPKETLDLLENEGIEEYEENNLFHNLKHLIENSKFYLEKYQKRNNIINIEINNNNYRDNFENWEEIGKGTYGTVYKAKIKECNELRAIKIIDKKSIIEQLKTEYNKDDIEEEYKQFINFFINEINNMIICSNNNLNENSIKYFECFNTSEEFVTVMELCDCNLQQLLNSKKLAFNIEEIKEILSQLNNTFKIMAQHKIIHRDLKLLNILVKFKNKEKTKFIVKLTDYGESKQLISLTRKCRTHAGTILTMAPEILNEEEYDSKCDLWSLGVIIYQLAFKQYPYNAQTEIGLIKQIYKNKQALFKKTNNKELDNLIRKLLEKDPMKRLSWNQYFNDPFFKSL